MIGWNHYYFFSQGHSYLCVYIYIYMCIYPSSLSISNKARGNSITNHDVVTNIRASGKLIYVCWCKVLLPEKVMTV